MQSAIPAESGWSLQEPLRAFIGVAILCLIAWALSSNRRRIPWRVVVGGLGLQLLLAGLILGVPATAAAFDWLARQVATAIGMADAGSAFLFGPLAAPDGPAGFVFAFRVLPVIVYFAAVMAALYHLGIMQRVVAGMAWVMRRTLGVSGAESLTVAANVLVGQTEAPLCVKPFLPRMTRSQLMVVMTGGFATIAGSVLAGYVDFLGGADEAARNRFAKHLLTASVMSAPAAFVMGPMLRGPPDIVWRAGSRGMCVCGNGRDTLSQIFYYIRTQNDKSDDSRTSTASIANKYRSLAPPHRNLRLNRSRLHTSRPRFHSHSRVCARGLRVAGARLIVPPPKPLLSRSPASHV